MARVNRDSTFNTYYQWGPGGVGRTHKVQHTRGQTFVTKASGTFASDQSNIIGVYKPKWWNPFQFHRGDGKKELEQLLGLKD